MEGKFLCRGNGAELLDEYPTVRRFGRNSPNKYLAYINLSFAQIFQIPFYQSINDEKSFVKESPSLNFIFSFILIRCRKFFLY